MGSNVNILETKEMPVITFWYSVNHCTDCTIPRGVAIDITSAHKNNCLRPLSFL